MLARRVHPQLAHHTAAEVGSVAQQQPIEQPDSATLYLPVDESEHDAGGEDVWLPTVDSQPSLPVTLRLCASGVAGCMEEVLYFLLTRSDINQLDLRANGLTDDTLLPLLTAMRGPLSHIRSLDLSGLTGFAANRIGQRTAEALSSLLHLPSCQLATLRLSAMGRTSLSACLLQYPCLAGAASLTSLDLSGNALTNHMVRALCKQVSGQRCALQRLHLAHNELTDACSDALAALVRCSPTLSELSLANNQFTGRGMHALASSLELDTCSLTSLALDDNCALGEKVSDTEQSAELRSLYEGTVGVDRLFRSLSLNSSLQRLSMCGCSMARVAELSASLASNSTLTSLLLDRNPLLGSTGCGQLLQSLSHNSTLLSLSLAHNRLDDAIAPHLARLIQANPYLQSLSLADNQLTDAFIDAVLPTVYLNSHCAVSRLDLTCNHLQGRHTERLHSVMQRNARVQRRRLLTHYQHTIGRLHALPGQLREAAIDIERLQVDCESERLKEASTAQRVQAERAAMEADTIQMRAQLDVLREERRQQTVRQSAELAALSSRLAAERGELKSQAAVLRQEVVNEKKIQAQLAKQISRATAVWDSLEEIRRSGDIVERSLQQQTAQLHSDSDAADQSCCGWATKLQHAATALVNRYWIALNTYTHSNRFADRTHSAQRTNTAQQPTTHPPHATLCTLQQQPSVPPSVSTSSLLSPAGVREWSVLAADGMLSFVPPLPAVGASFDVDLGDFLSWFFSTSTPSATLALIPTAMAKRMPIIAFAQAKCQTEAGRHTKLFVQAAVTQQQTAAQTTVPSSWPSRRSHVVLLGLLRLTVGDAASTRSPSLHSLIPSLFSGCTLVVHPADADTMLDRQRSADNGGTGAALRHLATDTSDAAIASAVTESLTTPSSHLLPPSASSSSLSPALSPSPPSPSSVLQLSIDGNSSWLAVLQAVSGLLSVDCSSPASTVQLSCLPGIRLCQPMSSYLELAADTPRLTLEEAMNELGGLNAITAAAAQRKQMVAVNGQAAAGEVSDTALPTLSDDLNQLLADIGADLILSARSRPPMPVAAAPHTQSRRANRRAESRPHSTNTATSGPPAADAAHAGLRAILDTGPVDADMETSSGKKQHRTPFARFHAAGGPRCTSVREHGSRSRHYQRTTTSHISAPSESDICRSTSTYRRLSNDRASAATGSSSSGNGG